MSLSKIMRHICLALFLMVPLLGCESQTDATTKQVKPENVPGNSIFVGGLDGGVYVLLTEASENRYASEVYYISGDLAYKGMMTLYPASAPKLDTTDKSIYQGWDGDVLYLSGNRMLVMPE